MRGPTALLLLPLLGPCLGQAPCSCRPQIQCAGAWDSLQELAQNTCPLPGGVKGLCCADTKKSPPPAGGFAVRAAEEVFLPPMLTDSAIGARLAGVKAPGAPGMGDREAQGHRLFTKARKEDSSVREAALRLLQVVGEFEASGISLRSSQDAFDAGNSVSVRAVCPWTGDRRPRCKSGAQYRTLSGACNNQEQPLWGMASTPQQRILGAAYSQPGSRPREAFGGRELPSARLVATTVFTPGDSPNSKLISILFMQMGQFIDHDITHSPATAPETSCCESDSLGRPWLFPSSQQLREQQLLPATRECFPIKIPTDDSFWGRRGRTCMEFSRADPSPSIPKCSSSAERQPMNAISHWLDASNVYGSTTKESAEVRDTQESFGFLKTTKGRGRELLPQCAREVSEDIEACQEICHVDRSRRCAFAGDFRVNEQPGLSMMHTLWVREHNRIATDLTRINPQWEPQRVYEETRRIVIAVWQNIVYNEWLPLVLGQQYMDTFNLSPLKPGQGYAEDYDVSIDPRINAEFAGAAFRFGHSMVPGLMEVMKPNVRRVEEMELKKVFNDPSRLHEQGFVDGVLLGQALNTAPDFDPEFSGDLMNHLFEEGDRGGLDLTSLNIQRGRDLGLQGYNRYRKICASKNFYQVDSFEELTRDGYLSPSRVEALASVYENVEDIDLFVGGMLEASHREALLGPTFLCIIGDQFARLKRADRFWFENGADPKSRLSLEQLDSVRDSSMARIVCDNTDITQVQPFAFRVAVGPVNERISCEDVNIPRLDLELWRE